MRRVRYGYKLRYGYGWQPLTFVDALFVLGVVLMGNGIRYAIFWNPQYRYEHLLIAGLGLLLSVPCGIYLRRKRREIQELK